MQIKKYEAVNMQEALRMVKSDLGPDAVILSSRKVKRGDGTFGIPGKPRVEVTAAIDYPTSGSSQQGKTPAETGKSAAIPLEMFVREDIQRLKEEIQGLLKNHPGQAPSEIAQIRDEIAGLRQSLEGLAGRGHPEESLDDSNPVMPVPRAWVEIYKRYVDRGVDEDLSLRMVQILDRRQSVDNSVTSVEAGAPDQRIQEQHAYNMILRRTRVNGPLYQEGDGRKASIFVGPTGAGKTTTLAKIAARYALGSHRKKVVLVTLDTYRIAAVEQLKIYAKILGVPAEVALSPSDLQSVFRRYREADLFLVDTAGRNQRDQDYISELASYCNASGEVEDSGISALEGHLVLPATLRSDVLLDVIRRFHAFPIRSLVFTKLDEVEKFGQIFSVMIRAQRPISYFTTGQKVPEDIEAATPEKLARLVVE